MLLLLAPPFDGSRREEPGLHQGLSAGHQDGGQYMHAALSVVMALAELGHGDAEGGTHRVRVTLGPRERPPVQAEHIARR